MDWRRPVPEDDQEWIADGAWVSSVRAGIAWVDPARVAPASGGEDSAASERCLGWGGASDGGRWGETERRPIGRLGKG
jgi:hypothetical protein